MPRLRRVTAAARREASAGPAVELRADSGTRFRQSTSTDKRWLARRAVRAARSRAAGVALVLTPAVLLVGPASARWTLALAPQPAASSAADEREHNSRSGLIGAPRTLPVRARRGMLARPRASEAARRRL